MDYPPKQLMLLCITLLLIFRAASAQADEPTFQISGDALLDQLQDGMPLYGDELVEDVEENELIGAEFASNRRSLLWGKVFHYYISYGALSANRVPCPPRSGRSYYTHNCFRARGPVHPYTRGCSAITRCRR